MNKTEIKKVLEPLKELILYKYDDLYNKIVYKPNNLNITLYFKDNKELTIKEPFLSYNENGLDKIISSSLYEYYLLPSKLKRIEIKF